VIPGNKKPWSPPGIAPLTRSVVTGRDPGEMPWQEILKVAGCPVYPVMWAQCRNDWLVYPVHSRISVRAQGENESLRYP